MTSIRTIQTRENIKSMKNLNEKYKSVNNLNKKKHKNRNNIYSVDRLSS